MDISQSTYDPTIVAPLLLEYQPLFLKLRALGLTSIVIGCQRDGDPEDYDVYPTIDRLEPQNVWPAINSGIVFDLKELWRELEGALDEGELVMSIHIDLVAGTIKLGEHLTHTTYRTDTTTFDLAGQTLGYEEGHWREH